MCLRCLSTGRAAGRPASCRRLAPAIPAQHRAAYMQAAVAGLAAGSPPPVQIGACRALAQLCQKARREELAGVAQQMFAGLCQLLRSSSGGRRLDAEWGWGPALARTQRCSAQPDLASAAACQWFLQRPRLLSPLPGVAVRDAPPASCRSSWHVVILLAGTTRALFPCWVCVASSVAVRQTSSPDMQAAMRVQMRCFTWCWRPSPPPSRRPPRRQPTGSSTSQVRWHGGRCELWCTYSRGMWEGVLEREPPLCALHAPCGAGQPCMPGGPACLAPSCRAHPARMDQQRGGPAALCGCKGAAGGAGGRPSLPAQPAGALQGGSARLRGGAPTLLPALPHIPQLQAAARFRTSQRAGRPSGTHCGYCPRPGPALQARMLPTLCGIIAAPQQHSSILVDGAVELITVALGPSPPEAAQQIHAAATPAMLQVGRQHRSMAAWLDAYSAACLPCLHLTPALAPVLSCTTPCRACQAPGQLTVAKATAARSCVQCSTAASLHRFPALLSRWRSPLLSLPCSWSCIMTTARCCAAPLPTSAPCCRCGAVPGSAGQGQGRLPPGPRSGHARPDSVPEQLGGGAGVGKWRPSRVVPPLVPPRHRAPHLFPALPLGPPLPLPGRLAAPRPWPGRACRAATSCRPCCRRCSGCCSRGWRTGRPRWRGRSYWSCCATLGPKWCALWQGPGQGHGPARGTACRVQQQPSFIQRAAPSRFNVRPSCPASLRGNLFRCPVPAAVLPRRRRCCPAC